MQPTPAPQPSTPELVEPVLVPEFWPRAWAPVDAAPALAFWLTNPLLLHHYPQRMVTTAQAAAAYTTNDERLHLVWRLRELRLICRTRLAVPQGLPQLNREQIADVLDGIEDAHERREMRTQSLRLHECELPWLAAHITAVLAARAALSSTPALRSAA